MLRRRRGGQPDLEWIDDERFTVAGTEFVCRPAERRPRSTGERLCLVKPAWSARLLADLLQTERPGRIFELGIYDGGSTAFYAGLARPEKLVAVDLKEERSAGLDDFVAAQGLAKTVTAHYGVDQSDREQLHRIVEREFGDASIDMVLDDASHLVEPTRRSFDLLFPRLRPGGCFVIEDWNWAHTPYDLWPGRTSLAALVLELVLASARHAEVIPEISINRAWALVRRGPAELDPAGFAIADLLEDEDRALLPAEPNS